MVSLWLKPAKLFSPNTINLANSPNINPTKHSRYTVKHVPAHAELYFLWVRWSSPVRKLVYGRGAGVNKTGRLGARNSRDPQNYDHSLMM